MNRPAANLATGSQLNLLPLGDIDLLPSIAT